MYRAIGLTALEKGVPGQDEQAVTALCQALSMTVGHAADGQHTLVDGLDVTGFIRTPEVSMAASLSLIHISQQFHGRQVCQTRSTKVQAAKRPCQ